MTEAILILTFSPVQSFIIEARRASDLYSGSHILVELAKAAAKSIEARGSLIYPAKISDDVPNKLVARIQWERAKQTADTARQALLSEWERIAKNAKSRMQERGFQIDPTWEEIWKRQIGKDFLWEIYWAASSLEDRSYRDAYDEASRALDAIKRSRTFIPTEELDFKDSLSGKREALHIAKQDAKSYWTAISDSPRITASKLRPNGRERLDAIGAIKRFGEISERRRYFNSTSSVAASYFLKDARLHLMNYRLKIEKLLGRYRYEVPNSDPIWPYDGDLLFMETLKEDRLMDSYGGIAEPRLLPEARSALRDVYERVHSAPSPYYAIILLDGDNMGEQIKICLDQSDPEESHKAFSQKLFRFSEHVRSSMEAGTLIYSGGDDVMALVPLVNALPMAQQLANDFKKITEGSTASSGIAIAHHLYPLYAALEAARQAERDAKRVQDKAAVCVYVLKRSGEQSKMCSRWVSLGENLNNMIERFKEGSISSRFAYDAISSAYALNQSDEKFRAEIKRLLMRHRIEEHPNAPDPKMLAMQLSDWAQSMPDKSEELGRWLAFARFVAQGGDERCSYFSNL